MKTLLIAGLAVLIVLVVGLGYTAQQSAAIEKRFPPTGSFVAVGEGARLHYTERRPVGGPRATVVLLHGASGNNQDLMVPLGDRLAARGFRVIAFDRPGLGWSDRPDGAADAEPHRQAALIMRALTALGVERAIVLGHSWAGALAADIALNYPAFAQGLVLVAPVLYPWKGGVAWFNAPAASDLVGPLFTRTVTLPAGQVLLPAGIAEVFAPQAPPPGFAAATGVALVLRPTTFAANAQDVLALFAFVSRQAPRMSAIAVATAIVAGDGDRVVSPVAQAERAAREVPGATLTLLPGRGHSPHWSDPDAVVAAVASVADRLDRGAPVSALRER